MTVNFCFASPVMTLRDIIRMERRAPEIQVARNKVLAAEQTIRMLKAESSVIFQGRVKAGQYTHFTSDGIPRSIEAKPKLGFKYYLFGGNKYMRHIMDQVRPAYYQKISDYDAAMRRKRKTIENLYLKYWRFYKLRKQLHTILRINIVDALSRRLGTSCNRLRLSEYLYEMKEKLILHELEKTVGVQLKPFKPLLPKVIRAGKSLDVRSELFLHPGIAGLIQYYHDQRSLGWLRFVDVKIKGFVRPSYYPDAGRTKWAIIAGLYVNIPFDIMGAVRHEDERLSLERDNIIEKLQHDEFEKRIDKKIGEIQRPMLIRKIQFLRAREMIYKKRLSEAYGPLRKISKRATVLIENDAHEYRVVINKLVSEEAKLRSLQLS
ncbi:hypothetical protein [Acidithiobacillus sp. AMEEHan]|uniref:hypothetical protein n=1 Tax=Acidithiobacillus sp. AMEEHan TaxID=2994951 RepID=UPI0027E3E261|nr:hypothetical protein [Acidithiobacillus sp. AMEEHan]